MWGDMDLVQTDCSSDQVFSFFVFCCSDWLLLPAEFYLAVAVCGVYMAGSRLGPYTSKRTAFSWTSLSSL